jgi:glycosyltransferase involved in cell wall biosynthesis
MSSPQRVLIVVSFANLAGAQIAAVRLARGLRDRGHDPKVIFLYEQGPVVGADHPYEVVLPKASPGVGGYVRIAVRLWQIIRQEKPDVVLTFLPLANVLGQAAALTNGIRRRMVSHRMPIHTASSLLRRLDLLWAWLGVYTGVVAVSESVRATCCHYPENLRERVVVVHNGLRDFRPSTLTREEARRRFNITGDRTVMVAMGRLATQKNYPFMLKLMSRLDKVQLVIAGDGSLRPQLEKQIKEYGIADRVRLIGSVARQDIPDLLAAADIFIQTSLFEGQSNSILEALHAGVPVLANDIPEQRETLADADGATAGRLLPIDDLDAWTAAVNELASSTAAVAGAKETARRRAELFKFDRMITGLEKALALAPEPAQAGRPVTP